MIGYATRAPVQVRTGKPVGLPKFDRIYEDFSIYLTRPIVTRILYILNPLFEGQKRFFKEAFSEKSPFMYGQYSGALSNQEWVMMARVQYINYISDPVYFCLFLFVPSFNVCFCLFLSISICFFMLEIEIYISHWKMVLLFNRK